MRLYSLTPILISVALHLNAEESNFLDFSQLSKNSEYGAPWKYYGPNEHCLGWVKSQGAFCRNDGWRFFWYYNGYQTNNMGFTRYGHMVPQSDYTKNDEILLVATGGAYRDTNNQVKFSGLEIQDIDSLESALQDPKVKNFATDPVPGAISLYYKHLDPAVKIPEFSLKTNRLNVMVWIPKSQLSQKRHSRIEKTSETAPHTIAMYPFINTGMGGHYYHNAMNRGYGHWVNVQFDSHPSHHNGGQTNATGSFKEGGLDYPGDGSSYFKNMTSFSLVFYNSRNQVDPYFMSMAPITRDYAAYENEETINNLAVGLDPSKKQFDISFEDKYRCKDCNGVYEVRYSHKPINNDNWDKATPISAIENYFVEDDGKGTYLIKPSPYYSQVWGKVSIDNLDYESFANSNKEIYFAVKDLSTRTSYEHDPDDYTLVDASPSGRKMAKRDLVKTIQYKLRDIPQVPNVSFRDMKIFKNDRRELPLTDTADVQYSVRTPDETSDIRLSKTPKGALVESNALISSGVGATLGQSSSGKLLDWQTIKLTVVERDCLTGVYCTYHSLAQMSQTGIAYPSKIWNSIAMDIYSGYRPGGVGMVFGKESDYQYITLSGNRITLSVPDVIEMSFTNTTDQDIEVPIHYSTKVSGRRHYTQLASWVTTPSKIFRARSTTNMYIKYSDVQPELDFLNINIPYRNQGLYLSSVALYRSAIR